MSISSPTYAERRNKIEHYFDRTAVEAWRRLTSDAPVGRIRATVRAGRDRMRATLLSWLPEDLSGTRILDAGCGTGALAVEAARRGAHVVAIDVAEQLVTLADERKPQGLAGAIDFRVGDMLDPSLGHFDHVVGMDSLIHYSAEDATRVLAGLADRTSQSIVFTFAPRTPFLAAFIGVGRMLPQRANRAPWIEPVAHSKLVGLIGAETALADWTPARTERISSGFYTSQALELRRG